jgi:hypothetical protein
MCCGKQRGQAGVAPRQPAQSPRPTPRTADPRAAPPVAGRPLRTAATFEYTGRTALTVVGPVTGQTYRFQAAGARLTVDLRDRPGLAGVPQLREVRG